MINIKDIESKLLNRKDKLVKIPKDTKFTQKNAYFMYIEELQESLNNTTDNQELNEYLQYTIKLSQNSSGNPNTNKTSYNQIQTNSINQTTEEHEGSKTSNKLIYADTDIINIPDFLMNFFTKNDINSNNYYLYGIKNKNSFFTALILLSNSEYIIKTRSEKLGYISSFKKELAINLDNFYKKYNYKPSKFSKNKMTSQLIDKDLINYPLKVIGIDFIKTNTCILDIENKEYMIIDSYEPTDNNKYYVIVKLYDNYLPLMNVNSCHTFDASLIDYFKNIYSPFNFDDIEFNERLIESQETETNSKSSIKLKSINSYKLSDLQEIAANHKISIKKVDSNKNKTKKDLYKEITELI